MRPPSKNGAVHFARASHRLGEIPHAQTGLPLFTKALSQPPAPELCPEVPALLQPGDASIHHFLTVHRSGPNNTDSHRRGFVLDYRGRSTEVNQEALQRHEAYRKNIYRESGAGGLCSTTAGAAPRSTRKRCSATKSLQEEHLPRIGGSVTRVQNSFVRPFSSSIR